MKRLKIYTNLVESILSINEVLNRNNKKQYFYGEEENFLYTVEAHTLSKVSQNEGITVSKLALLQNKTKSSVTQITNKLEKKGLLIKKRSDIYYKEINLYLTDHGKDICKKHEKFDNENYKNTLNNLQQFSDEDLEKCAEILEIIADWTLETNSSTSKNILK